MICEDAIEAAGRTIYELKFGPEGWDGLPDKPRRQYLDMGETVLNASAPLMAAAAPEERFTDDDLFLRWNEPGNSNLYKGIECQECGAAVINTERHIEWHNKGVVK